MAYQLSQQRMRVSAAFAKAKQTRNWRLAQEMVDSIMQQANATMAAALGASGGDGTGSTSGGPEPHIPDVPLEGPDGEPIMGGDGTGSRDDGYAAPPHSSGASTGRSTRVSAAAAAKAAAAARSSPFAQSARPGAGRLRPSAIATGGGSGEGDAGGRMPAITPMRPSAADGSGGDSAGDGRGPGASMGGTARSTGAGGVGARTGGTGGAGGGGGGGAGASGGGAATDPLSHGEYTMRAEALARMLHQASQDFERTHIAAPVEDAGGGGGGVGGGGGGRSAARPGMMPVSYSAPAGYDSGLPAVR